MNTPTLETPRLRLRPIREGDAEDIFACWMHDEEVSRYMEWSASDDIADAREFVRFELSKFKDACWYRWLIVLKDTGEMAGTCLVYYNDEGGHWDLSYNLGRAFWGRGITVEAMRAAIDFGAKQLGIKEIRTVYAAENTASAKVLKKLDFHPTASVPYTCGSGQTLPGIVCRYDV